MTKTTMILAYAQTGRTAAEIARELQVALHTVYAACDRNAVILAQRRPARRGAGVLKVGGVIRKRPGCHPRTWRNSPFVLVPATVLRAAGMEADESLNFMARDGQILITRATLKL